MDILQKQTVSILIKYSTISFKIRKYTYIIKYNLPLYFCGLCANDLDTVTTAIMSDKREG